MLPYQRKYRGAVLFLFRPEGTHLHLRNVLAGAGTAGIRPGDKRVWVKGIDETAQLPPVARCRRKLWSMINRCLLVDAHFLTVSPEHLARTVENIRRYNPVYFHGYAASIAEIARWVKESGRDARSLFPSLRAVVSESEKLYPEQRELFEEVFRVPVYENYGSVEFGMIAQPDTDGNLLLNEDHIVAESMGGDEEAVITNLDSFAFPFIRYKNGDRIRLGGDQGHGAAVPPAEHGSGTHDRMPETAVRRDAAGVCDHIGGIQPVGMDTQLSVHSD